MNDETSVFDPNAFLTATTTEAGSRRPPLPEGSGYIGTLGELKFRTQQGVKDPSKSYIFFDIPVDVDLTVDPKLREKMGQDSVRLTYSDFAEFTAAGLDWTPGKNRGLTGLREATNNNVKGKGFNPAMLTGHRVRVKIVHREYPEGSGQMQEKIVSSAKP